MKVFAALPPVVIVLVSLCGSPVPASNATVTGVAYFDANRNGIHDSCDGPLPGVDVLAVHEDGEVVRAKAGEDGRFRLDGLTAGDTVLTLGTDENHVWPVTSLTPSGAAGTLVSPKGYGTLDGVDVGAATVNRLPNGTFSISGIIFHDKDGDGEIGRDECGLEGAVVNLGPRTQPTWSQSSDSFGNYRFVNVGEGGLISATPPLGDDFWVPTSDGSRTDCVAETDLTARYGPRTLEANFGFQRGTAGDGSISGVVFDDLNANHVREEGEPGVSGAHVEVSASDSFCAGPTYSRATTNDDGTYRLGRLRPGSYHIHAFLGYAEPADSLVRQLANDGGREVNLADGGKATADFPVRAEPGAFVEVFAFDDLDGDGARDGGEGPVRGARVCLSPLGGVEIDVGASCQSTDSSGTATLGPVISGRYSVDASHGTSQLPRAGPDVGIIYPPDADIAAQQVSGVPIQLGAGETKSVEVGVDVVHTWELLLYPDATGVRQPAWEVCYSDPAYQPPPFEEAFDPDAFYTRSWHVTEELARGIYSDSVLYHPIYNQVRYSTWFAMLGLRDPLGNCPRRENTSGIEGTVIYLRGYEPTEVLQSEGVLQVRVTDTGSGLIGISTAPPSNVVLVVDGRYEPIIRCEYIGCAPGYESPWDELAGTASDEGTYDSGY